MRKALFVKSKEPCVEAELKERGCRGKRNSYIKKMLRLANKRIRKEIITDDCND